MIPKDEKISLHNDVVRGSKSVNLDADRRDYRTV